MNYEPPEWAIPFLPGVPRATIAFLARVTGQRLAQRHGVRYRVVPRRYGWLITPILGAR